MTWNMVGLSEIIQRAHPLSVMTAKYTSFLTFLKGLRSDLIVLFVHSFFVYVFFFGGLLRFVPSWFCVFVCFFWVCVWVGGFFFFFFLVCVGCWVVFFFFGGGRIAYFFLPSLPLFLPSRSLVPVFSQLGMFFFLLVGLPTQIFSNGCPLSTAFRSIAVASLVPPPLFRLQQFRPSDTRDRLPIPFPSSFSTLPSTGLLFVYLARSTLPRCAFSSTIASVLPLRHVARNTSFFLPLPPFQKFFLV